VPPFVIAKLRYAPLVIDTVELSVVVFASVVKEKSLLFGTVNAVT